MPVQQVSLELKDDIASRLFAIPSAVAPVERQLALHYAAAIWDGTGDVFENGPLLGGATRALAMGMLFNKQREPDSLLQTYDWFSLREPLDLPDDIWDALVTAGMLTRREVNEAESAGSFLPLFEALHRYEEYWPIVRPHVGYLPGHRDDTPKHGEALFTAPDREFGLAFVDGCKSWYGTKHWFREIASRLLPDADIMFQDFGHYTCFWISMLIATFRDRFELKGYVAHTYVWRLHNAPTEAEIELAFPDEPTCVDRATYDEAYDWLTKQAYRRDDRWGVMIHQAHLAAAYAYLGLLDESREILDRLLMQSVWMPYRTYLKQARISPAYTPEARIEL